MGGYASVPTEQGGGGRGRVRGGCQTLKLYIQLLLQLYNLLRYFDFLSSVIELL